MSTDPLTSVPADVAAARARGLNTEEFLWVKERVLEAEAAAMTARLNASVLAMLDRTLADLRARKADAADEGSRKLVAEQMANFEGEAERVRRESREKEPDSVRANVKTLEPFRARLAAAHEALDRPLLPSAVKEPSRPAASKWSAEPGDLRALLDEGLERGFSPGPRHSSSRRRRRSRRRTRGKRASSRRANAAWRGLTRSGISRL